MAKSDKPLILAIDDEESVLDIYESALSELGYDIITAATAKRAQKYLDEKDVNVVLMDIMMPDLDGITFTREIHSDPKTSHIPIIVCSGLDDSATLNDALMFGADDFLTKPFELDALKNKLEAALRRTEKSKDSG